MKRINNATKNIQLNRTRPESTKRRTTVRYTSQDATCPRHFKERQSKLQHLSRGRNTILIQLFK